MNCISRPQHGGKDCDGDSVSFMLCKERVSYEIIQYDGYQIKYQMKIISGTLHSFNYDIQNIYPPLM